MSSQASLSPGSPAGVLPTLGAAGPAPRQWISAPAEAHRLWRAGMALATRSGGTEGPQFRDYADHSTAMYRSLFGRFCRWMAGNGLKLHTIGAAELAQFLCDVRGRDGGAPSIRTRRMYLAEIDRVMAHLVSLELRMDRPTQELIEKLRMTEPLPPRNIVLPKEDFAPAMRERLVAVGQSARATPRALRDAASAALLIDCGLTVKELQHLRVKAFTPAAIGRPALLRAPGHRALKARDLDLPDWVAALLGRWIAERVRKLPAGTTAHAVANTKVFVHPLKKGALESTTVHRATIAASRACGVAAGPQMLRNEFVASLVRSNVAPERAAAMAGLHDAKQIIAMRQALGM